jgi:hypothetical protein
MSLAISIDQRGNTLLNGQAPIPPKQQLNPLTNNSLTNLLLFVELVQLMYCITSGCIAMIFHRLNTAACFQRLDP